MKYSRSEVCAERQPRTLSPKPLKVFLAPMAALQISFEQRGEIPSWIIPCAGSLPTSCARSISAIPFSLSHLGRVPPALRREQKFLLPKRRKPRLLVGSYQSSADSNGNFSGKEVLTAMHDARLRLRVQG